MFSDSRDHTVNKCKNQDTYPNYVPLKSILFK